MYLEGCVEDGRFHYKQAIDWLLKSANQGYASAQCCLSSVYADGRPGIPRDYVKAYFWISLANASGDTGVTWNLYDVARMMTPAQITEARKMAVEWKEKHPGK
ncbi:MAG: hypothetical protein PHW04_10350 [Candidatus Wallbacteria bacterium]|nr:hypothetical protein [Candidatus Wallbacteria bacterium]